MTQRERIEQILTAHDKAVAGMAQARAEMRNSHRHIVDALRALEAWASAHDAAADMQDEAIQAVMAANRAALALLREDGATG